MSGSHQTIDIATNPPGAKCAVYRDGMQVGTITSTPGSVTVSRKGSDLWVGCTKDHYDFTNKQNASDVNGWVWGNIGFGGLIGVVVDMATGAVNAYDHNVTIDLQTLPSGVGAPVGLPAQFPGPIARGKPEASVPASQIQPEPVQPTKTDAAQ